MTHSQHKRPLWIGVLLASVAPALCLLAVLIPAQTGKPLMGTLADAALIVAISTPVSLAAMLLVGLPYVIWLRSRHALNWLTVCFGAIVIGALTFFFLAWALSWDKQPPGLSSFLYGAGFGVISGLLFCAGTGPNNSFKPNLSAGAAKSA